MWTQRSHHHLHAGSFVWDELAGNASGNLSNIRPCLKTNHHSSLFFFPPFFVFLEKKINFLIFFYISNDKSFIIHFFWNKKFHYSLLIINKYYYYLLKDLLLTIHYPTTKKRKKRNTIHYTLGHFHEGFFFMVIYSSWFLLSCLNIFNIKYHALDISSVQLVLCIFQNWNIRRNQIKSY